MEERYWLRHPSLRGLLGPYHLAELRTALAAGSFPADSYALPRRLVTVGAGLGMLAAFLTTAAALIAMRQDIDSFIVVVGMGSLAWEIAVILVVATLLQAVFDIADCSLQGRAPDPS